MRPKLAVTRDRHDPCHSGVNSRPVYLNAVKRDSITLGSAGLLAEE